MNEDAHEDMIFIKTKNWVTIQLVKTIMENNEIYRVVDETDVPGLRVKILLPKWFKPLLNAKQFIKVVILHHPTLNPASFSQYQPSKTLPRGQSCTTPP